MVGRKTRRASELDSLCKDRAVLSRGVWLNLPKGIDCPKRLFVVRDAVANLTRGTAQNRRG